MRKESLLGKTFGRWTVVGEEIRNEKWHWKCVCECGKEQLIKHHNLTLGLTHGCHGCAKRHHFRHSARTQVLNIYKCNARNRKREWALTEEQFIDLTQSLCHYCLQPPNKRMVKPYETYVYNGIDRKDNNRGYTTENSLPCCSECNLAKGTRTYEAFVEWLNRFKLL